MTTEPYDSLPETEAHICRVQELMSECVRNLHQRGHVHDASKTVSPEKEMFDTVTGTLRGLTYGSDEYKAALAKLKPALDHHYSKNSHHPEHYPYFECTRCGAMSDKTYEFAPHCDCCYGTDCVIRHPHNIGGMSLFDILEMLMDWKAAGERHADGCIYRSLEINRDRFGISPQLLRILENTVREMGWEKKA